MKNNRKAVEDRQLKILQFVNSKGEAKIEELSRIFNISSMTVRRDLQFLEEQKFLSRIYGGAISKDKAYQLISQEEKIVICRDKISEYASRFVDSGDTLFINGSRTALHMLKYVKDKKVNVYTNNCWGINAAFPENVTINYTGGEIRSNMMVGEYVMRNILAMSADKTFLGCSAVYDDGEFRYDVATEIGINEAMISRTSKGLFVLADHSKIRKRDAKEHSYGGCAYDRPCTLITDNKVDNETVEKLQYHGVTVIRVPI